MQVSKIVRNSAMLVLCVAMVLLGCSGCEKENAAGQESSAKKETQSSESSSSYMGELEKGLSKGKEKPHLLTIRHEIKQYHALKGKWPESLDQLAKWRDAPLPELPEGRAFKYNPEDGTIEIVDAD